MVFTKTKWEEDVMTSLISTKNQTPFGALLLKERQKASKWPSTSKQSVSKRYRAFIKLIITSHYYTTPASTTNEERAKT